MRTSIFRPAPGLAFMAAGLDTDGDRDTFEQVFHGSLSDILYNHLKTNEARTLLGLLASNSGMVPQSAPGTACGLILRPLALASAASIARDDFRRMPLRGSTGHPIGGMGAIIDAITARCRGFGGTLKLRTRVARILHRDGRAYGVECENGALYTAPVVVSAINPKTLFGKLLNDDAVGAEMREEVARFPMRGAAFKMALALDGVPKYAGLPDDITQEQAATCQIRVAASMEHIEESTVGAIAGYPSETPIIWGLIPSVVSPELTPPGKHIMSWNIWHAPYDLAEGTWDEEKDKFAKRCIETVTRYMPDLPDHIIDYRSLQPLGLRSRIGHHRLQHHPRRNASPQPLRPPTPPPCQRLPHSPQGPLSHGWRRMAGWFCHRRPGPQHQPGGAGRPPMGTGSLSTSRRSSDRLAATAF